jgi:hypothetical protein
MFKLRAFCVRETSSVGISLMLAAVLMSAPRHVVAQTTISTGSIQGTITDPTGAVVPGTKVTVTNSSTGQTINLTSSGTGVYNSGALIPGEYTVKVEAKGFKTAVLPVTVQVGVTSPGSVTLELGLATTVISVETNALVVNTEQSTIQGVMTRQQIERLPIDGRNFLDLAQLEPGVQVQDGGNFDPTKEGFQAISLGGREGRTTRIEVDGVDISDETVGTTTQNIPASAIQEFQISQSSLDLSTELTSSGAVNVVTRSGSNTFHGESFLYARGNHYAARYGTTDHPFDREQYGVRLGGPLIKNRLFFFADWERTVQDLFAPVELPAPFTQYNGGFNSPFHESELMGRLDWQIKPNWRAFYRWTYDQNNNTASYLPNTFEPFANRNNTPVQAAGLDVTRGGMSHSIRFGYTRFRNAIADAVSGTNITNAYPGVDVHIAPDIFCNAGVFCSGANLLAPQATLQHNVQIKYDGTKIYRSHIIRFGVGVNRILGEVFASFFGINPAIRSSFSAANREYAATGPFPGGESNPLNYPVSDVRFGNGQGFFTEIPQFGYPAGGYYDTRFAWYLGDTWKPKRNFTVLFGLRYVRDTGRSDSDIASTPTLNLFAPGLGARVHQPNLNFAPQIGLAWDPWKSGKTVIRAGAGIFYENTIFNSILFDRPPRLAKGLFWDYVEPCPSGSLLMPDTGQVVDTSALCTGRIGEVAPQVVSLYYAYQASVKAAGASANPSYVGTTLANLLPGMFGPDYRTPRSYQFNVGVQREIKGGTVLSVDYIRNVGVHYLLAYDTNHVGDARYLNLDAANAAINKTNGTYGCGSGLGGIDCAILAGASIFDYAGNGLDSGNSYLGGYPASYYGWDPTTGAAFPGVNANVGVNDMPFPIGRSVYNALQFSMRTNKPEPFRGSKNLALQISYALSRFDSLTRDQDFLNDSSDYRNINHYFGPNSLDRTHQLSFGGVLDFRYAFRLAFTTHIKTALPANLRLPTQGSADLFIDDLTGDGTVADFLTGTNVGSFGRGVKVNQLNSKVDAYNSSVSGQPTPAGQALISAGLLRADQLVSLGGVAESVADAPTGQVGMDSLITTNLRFGWVLMPKHIWSSLSEAFVIEPQVSIFNLFNIANYDGPVSPMSGELNGGAGSVNGTTQALRTNRIGLGSGVFALGAPRTLEFGVRVSF